MRNLAACRARAREHGRTLASGGTVVVAALLLAACGGGSSDSPVDDAVTSAYRLVGVENTDFDGGADITAYVWNDEGTLLSRTVTFADGRVESLEFIHENGRIVAAEEDGDGDGVTDARRRYGFDANGEQVSLERDGDLDGEYESSTGWSIDESGLAIARFVPAGCEPASCASESEVYIRLVYRNGRLVRREIDVEPRPLDGIADQVMVLRHAEDGRLLAEETTEVASGATASTVFSYEEGPCVADFLNSESAYFCVIAPADASVGDDTPRHPERFNALALVLR